MKYLYAALVSISSLLMPLFGTSPSLFDSHISALLQRIPLSDATKVVKKVFSLQIPGFPGAYNPSIVKFENGFLLSFRYDDSHLNRSVVGLVRLDGNFRVIGTPVVADTTYDQQDARLFWYNGNLYSTATRVISLDPPQCPISLSQIDTKTLKFSSIVDLQFHPQCIEKNWVPLVSKDHDDGIPVLYYIYSHNPLHIVRVSSLSEGTIEEVSQSSNKSTIPWEKKWGKIRGGTPCVTIGKQQLAFFHSSFCDGIRWWWVIGAMTFENDPSLRIAKLSPFPILARKMYTTPLAERFKDRTFKVAFPGGFVEIRKNNRSLFYLVYGENDSGIKVLVLDKKRVLSSLTKFGS